MCVAYYAQIAVSKDIICAYYTGQSRIDINDFLYSV